jgi:non-specific serine/threonine protein kinase
MGHYRIVRLLGKGGMGRVYLAEDMRLGRQVALKVLPPDVADAPERRARFEREARAAARLNHPGVVTVHSFEEVEDEVLFLTMEYVDGRPLSREIPRGGMEIGPFLEAAIQLTAAVAAAHEKELTHRDLKPGNVMLTRDGRVKVLDFGIAKLRDEHVPGTAPDAVGGKGGDPLRTEEGMLLGTAAYMSPEQAAGRPVDHRSDIFSIGVILYEMSTGVRPFTGKSQIAVLEAIRDREPAPITEVRAQLPRELWRMVRRCLEKDAPQRYQSLLDLHHDLEDLRDQLTSGALVAPSPMQPERKGNLPAQLSSFVGREEELGELRELLQSTRLLTLVGLGGCGKTRLALRLSEEVRDEYENGAWLAELAALTDPAVVPQAVASPFGVREASDRGILEVLTRHLESRDLLLVLDNCEHLLAACASLADHLLQACPGLRIVATSREALGVAGEVSYPVPSLTLPEATPDPSAGEVGRSTAARLFVERTRAVRPDFALDDGNAPHVARICRRLDGIPLAIELAAARMRLLPVRQIAERLDDCFHLLTAGSRTALPHHKTLRAAMDWSHDLLGERERVLFRRLAVFAGGWTLEAAERLCPGEELPQADLLDALAHLVDRSLVLAERAGGVARYRFLNTVRQYAHERLEEAGEAAEAADRHLEYYLGMAEEVEPDLTGPRFAEGIALLEAEHENLRAALSQCAASEDGGQAGLRLGVALLRFWDARGPLSEGREALSSALARAGDDVPAALLAAARNAAGTLAYRQTDVEGAKACFEASLALRDRLGESAEVAEALRWLGNARHVLGDRDAALAALEESLALSRKLADDPGVANSLSSVGAMHWREGDLRTARPFLEESLAIRRRIGEPRTLAQALANLGILAYTEEDFGGARPLLREALENLIRIGAKGDFPLVLTHLGSLEACSGQARLGTVLSAAADVQFTAHGVAEEPGHLSYRDRARARVEQELTVEEFDAAWAEGRALTLEEAIALALGEGDGKGEAKG